MLKGFKSGASLLNRCQLCMRSLRTTTVNAADKDNKKRKQELKEERRRQHLLNRERKLEESLKGKSQASTSHMVKILENGKKDTSCTLPDTYSSTYVEHGWYGWWEKNGFFKPSQKDDAEKFVICLPPPNVTGTLHLGHALGCSIQDALIRRHQMLGHDVLWNPGSDHAGIATQVVVERKLWKERGVTRHDIGREAFTEEVWKWKKEKGNVIYEQLRRLGCSLDWSRDYFTLDSKMSSAVREAFIRLFDEGLIYRDTRLVNWSCTLRSAISDIEVDNLDLEKRTKVTVPGYDKPVTLGTMTHFLYPVHESEETLEVATTRLETMLGDVAVAVHPNDERYKHLHGKNVIHPIKGDTMPIVTDTAVDRGFGTGVVKITPGHDQTDFDLGKRNNLPVFTVIDDAGMMTNVPKQFMGTKRYDCRRILGKVLSEKGLLKDIKDHAMRVPICSRSGDVIEPLLKEQWYVDLTEMGAEARMAPERGELEIIPEHRVAIYSEWFSQLRDWCISRQLWWGHQIPAYKIFNQDREPINADNKQLWVAAHSADEAIQKAAKILNTDPSLIQAKQDEDVLDTWFSSALIPFTMLGWPQQTLDLEHYYPGTVLETATDILFFWVARMIMLGKKLTGQSPFKKVLLHGIVRDSKGQKMSKSSGNVIDPLHIINGVSLQDLKNDVLTGNLNPTEVKVSLEKMEKGFPYGIPEYGADALRFTLCSYNYKADNVNVDLTQIESHKKFCNKIWQAFKLCTQLWEKHDFKQCNQLESGTLTGLDAWILSRLSNMVAKNDAAFEILSLNQATESVYNFFWLNFCDVYLTAKNLIRQTSETSWEDNEQETQKVLSILHLCMDTSLRNLAPFMPFLAEELYHRLPAVDRTETFSICKAVCPQSHQYPWKNTHIEEQFDLAFKVMNTIRGLRTDFNFTKSRANVIFKSSSESDITAMELFLPEARILSRSAQFAIVTESERHFHGYMMCPINDSTEIHFQLQGLIDRTALIKSFSQKISKLQKQHEALMSSSDSDLLESKIKATQDELDYKKNCLNIIQSIQ